MEELTRATKVVTGQLTTGRVAEASVQAQVRQQVQAQVQQKVQQKVQQAQAPTRRARVAPPRESTAPDPKPGTIRTSTVHTPPPSRQALDQRRRARSANSSRTTALAIGFVLLATCFTMLYSVRSLLSKTIPDAELEQSTAGPLNPSSTPPNPLSVASQVPSPPAESSPEPTTELTQEKALQAITAWLKAKQTIFAQPYDQALLQQVTTGDFRQRALQSMTWLQQRQAAYRYRSQQILQYSSLQNNQITVSVAEQIELQTATGIDPMRSGTKTTTVTYTFAEEGGVWKITAAATGST